MAETLDYIRTLKEAIRTGHGCDSRHIESVPILEMHLGQTVWSGTVEVFELIGHSDATFCYAWGHAVRDTGNEVRIVTVLRLPPVFSPRTAVQVSIVADAKNKA